MKAFIEDNSSGSSIIFVFLFLFLFSGFALPVHESQNEVSDEEHFIRRVAELLHTAVKDNFVKVMYTASR